MHPSGNMTVAPPGRFFIYFTRRDSYTLVLQAQDPSGLSCRVTASVTVLNVNEPPVIMSSQALSVPENSSPMSPAGSIAGKIGSGRPLLVVVNTVQPYHGFFVVFPLSQRLIPTATRCCSPWTQM